MVNSFTFVIEFDHNLKSSYSKIIAKIDRQTDKSKPY